MVSGDQEFGTGPRMPAGVSDARQGLELGPGQEAGLAVGSATSSRHVCVGALGFLTAWRPHGGGTAHRAAQGSDACGLVSKTEATSPSDPAWEVTEHYHSLSQAHPDARGRNLDPPLGGKGVKDPLGEEHVDWEVLQPPWEILSAAARTGRD